MKKLLTITLALMMAAAIFVGCSSKGETNDKPETETTIPSEGDTTEETEEDPKLVDIVDAVKNAYGENYIPNNPITEDIMTSVYEINIENVDEYIAEEPMISMHVDRLIAIKAKEGKGEDVEKDLVAYKDKLVNDTIQYPMNLPKIASAQVIREDDYVFFIILGSIDERADVTEDDMAEFAASETQKGVDEIKKFF